MRRGFILSSTTHNEAWTRCGLDQEEAYAWAREAAGEPLPARVLNDKGWSVVLHLGAAVLKVTAAGAFPDGARVFELVGRAAPGLVPELLAWRVAEDGRQEMLFRPFGGMPVDELPPAQRADGLVAMASAVARVQASVTRLAPRGLVSVRARDVPALLDELLDGATHRCRTDHAARWSAECAAQEVPEDVAERLRPWRSRVAEWAEELEEGGWSHGIDHVDLLPHNANLLEDGTCVVYDWEQATLGVPLFSLDVLLAYAQSLDEGEGGLVLRPERATPTQVSLKEAYLAELPGPLDLALRLAPIRYGWAEWRQAEAAGVPHYGVDDVAWWLGRALGGGRRSYQRTVRADDGCGLCNASRLDPTGAGGEPMANPIVCIPGASPIGSTPLIPKDHEARVKALGQGARPSSAVRSSYGLSGGHCLSAVEGSLALSHARTRRRYPRP